MVPNLLLCCLSFRFSGWDMSFWVWHVGLRVELIHLPLVPLAIDINALVTNHNTMIFSQQNLYFVSYVLLYNIMSCYCFCAISSWKINFSLWNCFSPWNLIFKSSLIFPVWWDNFGSWLCQLSICYCHVSDVTLISMSWSNLVREILKRTVPRAELMLFISEH